MGLFTIVYIFLLFGLIRLLIVIKQPFLCSGIYTGVTLFFGLLAGGGVLRALIVAPIIFALSSLYFWLLARFESSALFWVIALVGIVIAAV